MKSLCGCWILLGFLLFNSVNAELTTRFVYNTLSSRINVDVEILRNDMNDIKTQFNALDKTVNYLIETLLTKPGTTDRQDIYKSAETSVKNSFPNQMSVVLKALENEKCFVRDIEHKLKYQMDSSKDETDNLKTRLKSVEAFVADIEDKQTEEYILHRLCQIESAALITEQEQHQASLQNDGVVAFTIGQDSNVTINMNGNIPFNKTITDIGAQVNSGVFQSDGLYKLQCYIRGEFPFTHNNIVSFGWVLITNVTVDQTYRHFLPGVNHVYGTAQQIYTTFTGIKLGSLKIGQESSKLSAFRVLSNMPEVPGGSTLLYKTTVIDTDGAFNINKGIFTALSGGVYIFHCSSEMPAYLELHHNQDYVCSNVGTYGMGSNTVLLRLKVGDTVTVKTRVGNTRTRIRSVLAGAQIFTDQNIASVKGNDKHMVAFSAGLSKNYTASSEDKVKFDTIFVNLNESYSQHSGEFVASVTGIYEFNYHALGQKDSILWLEMIHSYNTKYCPIRTRYINSLYSYAIDAYPTAGNAAVLYLNKGDAVYIKAHGYNALVGDLDQIYCTFSGYLVHA